MLISLPERVVVSATSLIASKCSSTQSPKSRAFAGVVEDEDRRALHELLDDRGLDAAALAEQPHAAVVAGDQRAFARRHRDVELALGVLAVDAQRPGEADRHLGHAHEVLDVARQHAGIEREAADVLERGAGALLRRSAAAPRPSRACSRSPSSAESCSPWSSPRDRRRPRAAAADAHFGLAASAGSRRSPGSGPARPSRPCARLRLHLGELAEVVDRLLHALLRAIGVLAQSRPCRSRPSSLPATRPAPRCRISLRRCASALMPS